MQLSYTESIYYQIKLTARYFKLLSVQVFDKLKLGISFEEFIALDIISHNENMCQRDLAKLLLKDRANTGRLINSLAGNNFIEIVINTKKNRLVKSLKITDKGVVIIKTAMDNIQPLLVMLEKKITNKELEYLNSSLLKYREALNDIIKMQI